jgi:hypothetical protein
MGMHSGPRRQFATLHHIRSAKPAVDLGAHSRFLWNAPVQEGWVGNQIAFHGTMTMLGVECQWRMTWTKTNNTVFGFVNEEQLLDGSWAYIDEWRFQRKQPRAD